MKNYIKKYFNVLDNNSLILKINILFLIFFMSYDSMAITIPLYINSINIGVSYYGTILAITLIIRSVIAIPISNLNLNMKLKLLINVIGINFCALIILVFIRNIFIVSIVFIIFLSSVSVLNIIINPILANISSKESYGLTFGVRDVFLFIGSATGMFLTGLIHNGNNYNTIFLFNIGLLFLISILIILIERDVKVVIQNNINSENNSEEKCSCKNKLKENVYIIKNDNTFMYYCLLCILLTIAASGFSYIPLLAQQYQISDKHIYYTMSTSLIISAILSITGGKIIDRNNKKKVYILYIFMLFISYICFSVNSRTFFLVGMFIYSLNVSLDNISQVYFFSFFDNEKCDKYFGIISTLTLITSSIATQIIGYIWDINYIYCILICTVIMMCTLIIGYLKLGEVGEEK